MHRVFFFLHLILVVRTDVPRCNENFKNIDNKPFCFPLDYNKVSKVKHTINRIQTGAYRYQECVEFSLEELKYVCEGAGKILATLYCCPLF